MEIREKTVSQFSVSTMWVMGYNSSNQSCQQFTLSAWPSCQPHLVFFEFLILLITMPSRFFHGVTCVRVSFLCKAESSSLGSIVHNLSIYLGWTPQFWTLPWGPLHHELSFLPMTHLCLRDPRASEPMTPLRNHWIWREGWAFPNFQMICLCPLSV